MPPAPQRRKPRSSTSSAAATPNIPIQDEDLGWVLLKSFILVSFISVSNVAAQLALHPLYGGTTSSMHFPTVSLAMCLLAPYLPHPGTRSSFAAMSLILPASPVTLYLAGDYTTRWKDPFWGPIVTQAVGAIPILLLSVGVLHTLIVRIHSNLALVYGNPFIFIPRFP